MAELRVDRCENIVRDAGKNNKFTKRKMIYFIMSTVRGTRNGGTHLYGSRQTRAYIYVLTELSVLLIRNPCFTIEPSIRNNNANLGEGRIK